MAGPEISDEQVLAAFPNAVIDHDSKAYFKGLLQRRLLLNRCDECGHWNWPIYAHCPRCWSDRVTPTEVSGRGSIYLLTRLPLKPGSSELHPVGAVTLAEGPRFTTRIVNCDPREVRMDMAVQLTWMEQEGAPLPVFEPAAE